MNAESELAAEACTSDVTITMSQAIEFVWCEADMLDRLDYKRWIKLWSANGLYVIPTERGEKDYAQILNIAHDDGEMRRARVKRLLSGFSMSSAPPARTVRTMSRFVVDDRSPDRIGLRCGMILAEYKYERMRVLAADVEYRLLREEGELRIDRKIVTLVNADDFLHGLGYLL